MSNWKVEGREVSAGKLMGADLSEATVFLDTFRGTKEVSAVTEDLWALTTEGYSFMLSNADKLEVWVAKGNELDVDFS